MRKFIHRLRTGDRQISSSVGTQSDKFVPGGDKASSSLRQLAKDPDRFGLRLIPPLPLEPIAGQENFDVDIIAVHGLGGDFFRTWTKIFKDEQDEDILWLSHLLPVDLPGARIYSFGYASAPAFSRSVANIKEFATQLLQSLLDQTEAGKRRPTIFICHSLGGIIVKQAMVTAHEKKRFAEVLRTTQAIMFMGTPHRGSDIAASLGPLIDVVNLGLAISGGSLLAGSMRADLIQVLARESSALDDINESFIPRVEQKHIISCYETEWPKGFNQLIVSKQSALLRIPEEEEIPLPANHMNMCRFSSLQDPRYRLISAALQRVVRLTSTKSESTNAASAESLHSLTESERKYTSYFRRDFQPVLSSDRIEGTCKWFLDTPEYQNWQKEEGSAVLWMTGDAGCGKTTLSSFLTEVLRAQAIPQARIDPSSIVLSFQCAKDIESRNNAQSILCGLISAILTSKKNLIRRVRAEFASMWQEFGQSLESLWKIFLFALDTALYDYYYIIVDGLDECQARSREKLISSIGSMLELSKDQGQLHGKKLKILFTSQPQTITEWKALGNSSNLFHLKIEDRPSGMIQDIVTFINYKVDQLVALQRCTLVAAAELKDALYRKAQNSFLWVSLVLEQIKTTILLYTNVPQQLLAEIPEDLKGAYARYLPSVTPQNRETIKRCVQLLVGSVRTLNLDELGAFASVERSRPRDEAEIVVLKNSIQLMFGPLIRFPNQHVSFVHSTVRDFFLELGTNTTHALSRTYGTDIASAHLALAEACINYLLLDEISNDLFNENEPSSAATVSSIPPVIVAEEETDDFAAMFNIKDVMFLRDEEDMDEDTCSQIRTSLAAFDYAATHWAHHYASCEHIVPEKVAIQATLLSDPSQVQFSNWYRYWAHQSKIAVPKLGQLDPLLVAAIFDHPEAQQRLLANRFRPSIAESQCKSALLWAASQGHARVVQAFLDHGINPNFLDNGQSPLILAVLAGHQTVCSVLLKSAVTDPNLGDRRNRTPLVHAVASDQHEIIDMLLGRRDIVVDNPDSTGFNALLEASFSGCLQCLRRLQSDKRSDFSRRDKKGRTPLSYAACTQSHACVDLVLREISRKDMQSFDSSGRNAISYAAEQSSLQVVKRLWRSQISVSHRDATGRNAISWAVSRPSRKIQIHERNSVLKFLIQQNPREADKRDKFGWTPLAWALERPGYIDYIRILVETGEIDINQRDKSGRPALAWAASEGFEDITRYLLLVPGIEKNLQDFAGRTPISHAAGGGSFGVLRLLIDDQDIDPGITDHQGRSLQDWARLNNRDEAVEFLNCGMDLRD